MFPIGNLEKPQVRKIADELGLASAQKKDSQGICFVGKVDLPVFLQSKESSAEQIKHTGYAQGIEDYDTIVLKSSDNPFN